MRIVDSSEGDEHVRRMNELLASEERVGLWVVLSEAVVDQLLRSGRDFESSLWLSAPPQAALRELKGWVTTVTGKGRLSGLPQELLDEAAAANPRGQTYVDRVRRALPVANAYEMALWADTERELRQDFDDLMRALDAWAEVPRNDQ